MVVYDRDELDPLALKAACHLARTLALATSCDPSHEIDADYVSEQIERLTSAVDEGRSIRRGINAARKDVDAIEAGYDELRATRASRSSRRSQTC